MIDEACAGGQGVLQLLFLEQRQDELEDVPLSQARELFRKTDALQTVKAGAAGGDQVGHLEALFAQIADHGRQVLPVVGKIVLKGRIHARGQQRIAAAEVTRRHGHGKAGPEQQHDARKADAVIEEPAPAAGEIDDARRALRHLGGREDGAPVQAQRLVKVGIADLGTAPGKERVLHAPLPDVGDEAQDAVLHLLAQRGHLGGLGHPVLHVLHEPFQRLFLEGMAAGVLMLQQGPQGKGHIAGGDLDRTVGAAASTGRAVLHQIAQPAQELVVDAALVDLRIIDRLDEHAEHHVLVAGMVLHAAFGVVHGADVLALAAARAHLHGGQQVGELLLVRQAAVVDVADEVIEGEGEGAHGQLAVHELGRVHDVARVDTLLEGPQGLHLLLAEKGDLGDAYAVFAGDLAAHFLTFGHDAGGRLLGFFQHVMVIGVDRDVDVAVAVPGVHVAGHHDAPGVHVVADLVELAGQVGIFLQQAVHVGLRPPPELGIRQLRGADIAGGHLGGKGELAVEFLFFHGEAGQAAHLLERVAVGLRRAFQIELLKEESEIRDAVHGDDHVLVELEAGRALGDGGEAVAVFPEALGFLVVLRYDDVHVLLLFHHGHDVAHALVQQVGIVAVHLEDDDGDGQIAELAGLALVVDGLHVFGVEFFQRGKMRVVAFFADAVAQAHELAHHHGRRMHGTPEEFQHHDALVARLGMQDETGLGDDAVHAFLLHAGQAAQRLVGHVLAETGQADLVAAQVHHVAHAAAHVLDHKDGGLFRQDLVAGMVLPLHGDDFARGRDHAPPEQIVQGGAVFEGHGAAGILRDVAADGRGLLGGRVHRKERAFLVHSGDDGLRVGPGLTGDRHGLKVDGADMRQPRKADDDRAPPRGHGPARCAGTAAARDEGEFHVIGQLDQRGHLFGIVRLHHQQGQLHAQVRGVGGGLHQGRRMGQHAFGGQHAAQGLRQTLAEIRFRLVGGPEHGDAFADGGGIIVRQRQRLALEAFADAGPHRIGVDEGIVGYQKEFFGNGDGQMAHGFRPLFKVADIDAQNTVDDIIGRYGDMRSLVGHVLYLPCGDAVAGGLPGPAGT